MAAVLEPTLARTPVNRIVSGLRRVTVCAAPGILIIAPDWTGGFPETAFDVIPRLFTPLDVPYAVVMNHMGVWGCPAEDIIPTMIAGSHRLRQIYAERIKAGAPGQVPLFYFKSTTAARGYADRATCAGDGIRARRLLDAGWRFLDAFNITASAAHLSPWLDSLHFE